MPILESHPKNPDDLSFELTYTHILRRFHMERRLSNGTILPPAKNEYTVQYEKEYIPSNFMPILVLRDKNRPNLVTRVDGPGQEWVHQLYVQPMRNLFFRYGSPRDRILRGQFNDANLALSTLKYDQDSLLREADAAPDMERRFQIWTEQAVSVFADEARALTRSEPGGDRGRKVEQGSPVPRCNPAPLGRRSASSSCAAKLRI